MDHYVVISGCSGGGKSTLLDALNRLGHHVVKEPGRRIVTEELTNGGSSLPWEDSIAFARRAVELSLADRAASKDKPGWVFFDRGLIDAAAALQHLTGEPVVDKLAQRHGYNENVFLTPPWPEIYVRDNKRRHDLSDAVDEYDRLCEVYPSLGYNLHVLPKVSVAARADFVIATLEKPKAPPRNIRQGQAS
ncbi:MAG: AAA family ATPase [Geminicoccaceae bacterium]